MRRSSHGGIPVKYWNDTHSQLGYVQRKYNHSYALHSTRYPIRIAHSHDNDDNHDAESWDDESSFTVRAVYYVNTKLNSNYTSWIRGQFRILPTIDELFIVADAWSCQNETALDDAMAWLHEVRHEHVIELDCYDNSVETYEYHGIHKLWELGQRHSKRSDVALYFHSKGVTHAPTFEKYLLARRIDSALTRNVFGGNQLDRMLEAFNLFPDIDKAGYDCSSKGFVWYNFFLVRGSYLNQLEVPVVTHRRHYYEDYLARWGLTAQTLSSLPTTERRLEEYPDTSRRCYALSGDRIRDAANIGFYHDPNVESSLRNRERLPLG